MAATDYSGWLLRTVRNEGVRTFTEGRRRFENRGQYDEAVAHYSKALEIVPNHPTVYFYRGRAYFNKGYYEDAISDLTRSIESVWLVHRLFAWFTPYLYQVDELRGRAYHYNHQYEEAVADYKRAIGKYSTGGGAAHHSLAFIYFLQGKYTEAEPMYKEALRINEKDMGREHVSVGVTLHDIALLYQAQAKQVEAESFFLRALAIPQKKIREDPNDVLALTLQGVISLARGSDTEANTLLQRALATLGDGKGSVIHVIAYLHDLGGFYTAQGKYSQAESLYKTALAFALKGLGTAHPEVAHSMTDYATLLRKTGREAEASDLEARAKAIRAKRG